MSWFASLRAALLPFLVLTSLGAVSAHAEWPPTPSGRVPLCESPAEQQSPASAPDGWGGAIVAWTDYRNGTADIYAQRVDGSGGLRWPADGIAVCVAPGSQSNPLVVTDAAGGAIVLWQDDRDVGRLRAQRLDASGEPLWPQEVLVCAVGAGQREASACADGIGGALVSWQEYRAPSDTARTDYPNIYAQRLDSAGARLWTDGGVAVCTADGWQIDPTIVPDGSGGAIVIWDDARADWDVYAQRVSSGGAVAWTAGGIALVTEPGYQLYHDACADGAGGAIVAWSDGRGPEVYDIYTQRINSSGTVLWGANGLGACVAPGSQVRPAVATDGAKGAIITFEDQSGTESSIGAQHVGEAGTLLWPAQGLPLAVAPGYKQVPRIVTDGAGGAIVVWEDARNSASFGWDLYGQQVDAHGRLRWANEGAPIQVGPGSTTSLAMVPDGGSGAILAWCQLASTSSWDIYAQHVGEITAPTPLAERVRRPSLAPIRPNPAPDGATLRFMLPLGAEVTLAVHDQQGRRLRSLVRGSLSAGEHTWRWDGRDDRGRRLPSGVYFVTLEAGGVRLSRRVTVVH